MIELIAARIAGYIGSFNPVNNLNALEHFFVKEACSNPHSNGCYFLATHICEAEKIQSAETKQR